MVGKLHYNLCKQNVPSRPPALVLLILLRVLWGHTIHLYNIYYIKRMSSKSASNKAYIAHCSHPHSPKKRSNEKWKHNPCVGC